MRACTWQGFLGCCLVLWGSAAQADEWRPVRSVNPQPSAAAIAAPVSAPRSHDAVRLGAPAGARAGLPQSVATVPHVTASSPLVVRGQGGDGGHIRPTSGFGSKAGSEEDFNCGVVTEGPPAGGPFGGGGGGGWFDGFSNLLGGSFTFQSDSCFNDFISPITNPFFFEDPRSLTELRPIFMYQKTPGSNPLFRGGDIEMYALQARLALNERFSFVLHKLGYIAIQPDGVGPAAVPDSSGFAELQLGAKYTFWRDDPNGTIAALGLNFEIATGSSSVFQDTGSGAVTPYLTAGQRLGAFHLLGSFGYRFAFDNERSDSFFTSLHLDYSIANRIYPLVELNWYHYTNNGTSRPFNFEGQDLFNFGSTNIAGADVVTLAAGVRFKIIPEVLQAGVAIEFPISKREDLMDYRITADVIIRY